MLTHSTTLPFSPIPCTFPYTPFPGIGKEVARQALEAGASVVTLVARKAAVLAEAKAELEKGAAQGQVVRGWSPDPLWLIGGGIGVLAANVSPPRRSSSSLWTWVPGRRRWLRPLTS